MWKFHCGLGILYDPCPLAPVVDALFRRQNFTDVGSGYTFIGISIFKKTAYFGRSNGCPDALVKSLALTSALRTRTSRFY